MATTRRRTIPRRFVTDSDGTTTTDNGDEPQRSASEVVADVIAAVTIVLPSPAEPLAVARELVLSKYTWEDGSLLLRHWRGGWWQWCTSHWVEVEALSIRDDAYRFTENAVWINGKGDLVPWSPSRHKITDLLDAVAPLCYLPETVQQPTWTDRTDAPEGVIVACANGLLDVATRTLSPHDPRFFNQTAAPFDYDASALEPTRWLTFLEELWPDDPTSIDVLQEWFGYVISGRLDLQKILLMVGPTRGGKGAIARVLGALVGRGNVAGPTLASLGTDFGLAPLIGRPLAIVSDARLTPRGSSQVVERLLAISGEDTVTVNRKYRDQWNGKLPSRFVIISNELPQFGDASSAIVGRFVVLLLTRSWLGEEDRALEGQLHTELPEILSWSLDGLDRLDANGCFTVTDSTEEAFTTLAHLASPVAAFVSDRCTRDPVADVACNRLYRAWKVWAEDNGIPPGSSQRFGRDLRAVIPGLRVARPGLRGDRTRVYVGVSLP